jgi:YHS domain-containing protein
MRPSASFRHRPAKNQFDDHRNFLLAFLESLKSLKYSVEVMCMAKDPVCNMTVDEQKAAATSIYKGSTYYFCAKICKEKFDKDPEKFVAEKK